MGIHRGLAFVVARKAKYCNPQFEKNARMDRFAVGLCNWGGSRGVGLARNTLVSSGLRSYKLAFRFGCNSNIKQNKAI
jgi:hypothetical protein